jgi:hypothetical protein
MGRNLVDRRAAVEATEREGEAGARRRERAKAERLEHAGGAGVPGVGDHERLARMERGERRRFLFLPTQHHASARTATVTRLSAQSFPSSSVSSTSQTHVVRPRCRRRAVA